MKLFNNLFLCAIILSLFSCTRKAAPPPEPVIIRDTVYITKEADAQVQLETLNASTMYYECGNLLVFKENDQIKDIKVMVSSAQALTSGSNPFRFTIVPSGKKTTVSASVDIDGRRVKKYEERFNVIKPPKPTIEVIVNGKVYNGVGPISKKSNLLVKIKPDPDFQAYYPQDARYVTVKVDLLVQRSLGAPTKVATFRGSGDEVRIPLGNNLRMDSPGTKIYLKIDDIYRKNFKNSKIKEAFSEADLYRGLIIK